MSQAAQPPAIATQTNRQTALAASQRIILLAVGGFLLMAIGLAVAIAQAPSTSPGLYGGTITTGNSAAYGFGLILAGVGGMLVQVALIAWAVMLGIRATRD